MAVTNKPFIRGRKPKKKTEKEKTEEKICILEYVDGVVRCHYGILLFTEND